MIDIIRQYLKSMWQYIKKIFVQVIHFFQTIVSWFKDRTRAKKAQQPNVQALAMKVQDAYRNKNYNECDIGLKSSSNDSIALMLFDSINNVIIENEILIIECEEFDNETKFRFGNKEMLLLH